MITVRTYVRYHSVNLKGSPYGIISLNKKEIKKIIRIFNEFIKDHNDRHIIIFHVEKGETSHSKDITWNILPKT